MDAALLLELLLDSIIELLELLVTIVTMLLQLELLLLEGSDVELA